MSFDVHSKLDFADPGTILREQMRLLTEQIAWCRTNSPFYRGILRNFPDKNITPEMFAELPFTGKKDLAEHNDEFIAVPPEQISDISFTSGTTGKPCRICYTHHRPLFHCGTRILQWSGPDGRCSHPQRAQHTGKPR